jgi:hypothetical protein
MRGDESAKGDPQKEEKKGVFVLNLGAFVARSDVFCRKPFSFYSP